MSEVIATLPAEELAEIEKEIRAEARARGALVARAPTPLDPFHPVSAVVSDPEDAIGLILRGVRVAPFAETIPLLPLYATRKEELPAELKVAHEEQDYDFFLVQLTFSLDLADDEAPDCAEFAVEIHDGVEGARGSRTVEVFPRRVDATWFKVEGQLTVGLDASLKFSVEHYVPSGKAHAGGDVVGGVKVLAGPFRWEVGRAELEVRGAGDREIAWTYKVGRALEGKNDFKSFLVLKVARETVETKKVSLLAKIGVRPYRRTWHTLWLREKLPVLHARAVLDLELSKRASAPAPAGSAT